VYTWIPGMTG